MISTKAGESMMLRGLSDPDSLVSPYQPQDLGWLQIPSHRDAPSTDMG